MAGVDYKKLIEIAEARGDLKKAADYYALLGDSIKAYHLYEEVLKTTDNRKAINDIDKRVSKLDLSKYLLSHFKKELIPAAKKRSLEKRVGVRSFAFFSIATLISALFFVSFSLTGNAILGLSEINSRWIGICLFACGLVFAFLYFKKRK